jgi:hypothetical protein
MATYEVTAPDGAVYEIEGPDDADPQQVIAQLSNGSQATPAPQQPQRSIAPSAGGRANAFADDDLLSDEAMARLAAGERSTVTPSPEPSAFRGAGEYLSGVNAAAGKLNRSRERVAGLGTLEALGSLASGVIAAPAGSIAGIGTEAARGLGLTHASGEDVAERVQNALTYQPRSESGKAQLGLVATVTEPITESGADMALLPLAGGSSALGAPRGAPRRVPKEATVNPLARDSVGASAAAPNLTAVTPELRASLERAAQSGVQINREVLTRHIEADQLPIPMRLTRGQATQDPIQISREMNARARNPELASLFNEQNQTLVDNLDEIRAQVSPSVVGHDHIQNGQALIDLYKTIDEPMRAEINEAYRALDNASGGHFPLDAKKWAMQTQRALKNGRKSRFLPAALEGELSDFAKGTRMSFRDFEEMRTTLAAEARKAERSGDGNARAAIHIMRENLEAIPMSAGTEPIKQLADRARQLARARFERIESDPAYAAAIDDGVEVGAASPLADTFVDKYIVRGKAAHLERMRANLSSDPLGQELIAAGALNYLKRKAGVDLYNNSGNFSQAAFNRALTNDVLPRARQLLPTETAEMLERLGNVARYTQVQPRGSFVNNSNTFTSAMGEHVGNVLEGVANVSAGGVPVGTYARKRLQGRAERKFVEESIKPGAGIE